MVAVHQESTSTALHQVIRSAVNRKQAHQKYWYLFNGADTGSWMMGGKTYLDSYK